MNLERLLELVFNNPDDISIQYSNINGKEKLVVNGEDLTNQSEDYNDSQIKEKIAKYKEKIDKLDDDIFELVIDEAEKRHFNLSEMNKGLELEHYTSQDEIYANNVMEMMTELIQEVIKCKIQNLMNVLELF